MDREEFYHEPTRTNTNQERLESTTKKRVKREQGFKGLCPLSYRDVPRYVLGQKPLNLRFSNSAVSGILRRLWLPSHMVRVVRGKIFFGDYVDV
jgi:hypothetical protein